MNTVQLECFVTVAEYLNFSKASQVLKITQPAVTHQIQALEKELGTKLFLRTSKTVTLTREGVQFLGDAQLILKTALSAKERLGNREQYITLVLGCHNHMELSLLPPVLHDLAGEYSLLRPDIRMIPFPSLMGLIENEQVHAALSVKLEHRFAAEREIHRLFAPPDPRCGLHCPDPHPRRTAPGGTVFCRKYRKRLRSRKGADGVHAVPRYHSRTGQGSLLYPHYGSAEDLLRRVLPV